MGSSASTDNGSVRSWAGQTCTLVVLGESGVGKSSVLNTLAQQDDLFKTGESPDSVTLTSVTKSVACQHSGVHLHLIDTPGTRDTNERDAEFVHDIQESLKDSESINAFLFVMNGSVARVSQYRDTLKMFGQMLGPNFFRRLVFCFTHMDFSADDPQKHLRAEQSRKARSEAISKMFRELGPDGAVKCIFLDNELLKHPLQERLGDWEDLRKNLKTLLEFAMTGEAYSCMEVVDESILMPFDAMEARKVGEEATRKKIREFDTFILQTMNNDSSNSYLQYALIFEHQDKLIDEWIEAVGEHAEHVYSLFEEFKAELRRKVTCTRDAIFGEKFVRRQQALLRSGNKDLDSFRRCPFCNIVWWNEGGCQQRRCGHQGAPDWNVDFLQVPRLGRFGLTHGCGRKFEWPMAPAVSQDHLDRVLAPHQRPEVRPAKDVSKAAIRTFAKKTIEKKKRARQQAQRAKESPGVLENIAIERAPVDQGLGPQELALQPEGVLASKRRKIDDSVDVLPLEGGKVGERKCYLPNAIFMTPDGNFFRAKAIAVDACVRSVEGQALSVVRVSHHESKEKQHIIELVTAQGNFKISASHKIRVPGKSSDERDFVLAGHLKKGDSIIVGTKTRKLDTVRREWTRTELVEIGFQPDLPVEMFMIKEYGLQTYGSDSSIPAAALMDTITEEDLLHAQPDEYVD